MFQIVKKEAIMFMVELFKSLQKFHRTFYMNDDFVRLVFDKKLLDQQTDMKVKIVG